MATLMRIGLFLLLVVGLFAVGARRAEAYPQFQFSSGTARCAQCHFSPSGGGLLTSWGRDESGDTISMAGSGAFLHGAWTPPEWLALGADFRFAGLVNDTGGSESKETAFFPMQLDVYGRLNFGDISLNVTIGDRGEVRPDDASVAGRVKTIPDRFVSREHYLMWRPSASGPYLRLGKFQVPYGIRFVEHPYFVRRYTGFDLYEETYNLSGGYFAEDWEAHITAFTPPPTSAPDFFRSVGYPESGAAAFAEKRYGGVLAVGLQARAGIASEEARYQGGAEIKYWLEPAKLLFMGEADLIHQTIKAASASQDQFVSFVGATLFPVKGLMVGAAYERYQEDLSVKGTGRNAIDGQINLFPYAHFELVLLGRYEPASASITVGTTTTTSAAASLGMLQLHYYL
jgi:hypothetical protein